MTNLSRVFCIVSSNDKYEAIDEIIAKCSVFSELPDKAIFVKAVHKRERQQSTGIGHGVAIAHGKLPDIRKPVIALGFSEEGIIFDDRYPDPVKLIFVIASSLHRDSDYLKAVSSILTWVHDPDFRRVLVSREWESESAVMFFSMLESQEFRPQY